MSFFSSRKTTTPSSVVYEATSSSKTTFELIVVEHFLDWMKVIKMSYLQSSLFMIENRDILFPFHALFALFFSLSIYRLIGKITWGRNKKEHKTGQKIYKALGNGISNPQIHADNWVHTERRRRRKNGKKRRPKKITEFNHICLKWKRFSVSWS